MHEPVIGQIHPFSLSKIELIPFIIANLRVSQSRVQRVLSTGADFTKITAVSHFIKNSNLKNKKIRISDASRNISIV